MARRRDPGWLAPVMGLLAALALAIVPLPDGIAAFRPDWVALALIYWAVVSPGRFGLISAFMLGLVLDTLSGALLGQHALALLIVVYLSQRFYLRIRVFPASQMALTAAVLLAVYQFVLFWVDGVAGRTVPMIERWAPVIVGTMAWMLAHVFVDRGRAQAQTRI